MSADDVNDGWMAWSKHVLAEIERLDEGVQEASKADSDMRVELEALRGNARGCKDSCIASVKRLEERSVTCEKLIREVMSERIKQDYEEARARRRATVAIVICVVAGLLSVAGAIITSILNSKTP